MIALRRRHHVLRRRTFLTASDDARPAIVWHGPAPCEPDFSSTSRFLAFALDGRRGDRPGLVDRDLFIACNAAPTPQVFQVPAAPSGRGWRRTVDTALPSPDDALGLDEGPPVGVGTSYRLEAHAVLILVSEA